MTKRTQLMDLVSSIPDCNIRKVYDMVKPILEEHILPDNQAVTILCCPHCGSVCIKKNGKSNGNQRFYCNDCHKSFVSTTNSFLYHSRIPKDKWLDFIDYEMASMSLKDESFFLGLSIHTCFRMRHKLYAAITELEEETRLNDTIQLDASYRKINLKGTKPQNMPRWSKKRGGGSAYSGISHHKICIISAIDCNDEMFLKIVGLGAESYTKYKDCKYRFGNPELIVSDSKSSIQMFANDLGVKNDKIPTAPNKKRYTTTIGNHLGDLNQLDSEITSLIQKTHGCSTRYFQGYLNFITFKKKKLYRIDRDKVAEHVYNLIKETKAYKESDLIMTEMPISLKEAYFEYRYGIFQ